MKATLSFNLDDQDDKIAHMRAVKSLDMALVLWELLHNFSRKYENKDDGACNIQDVMDDIQDLMNAHGVYPDDLII